MALIRQHHKYLRPSASEYDRFEYLPYYAARRSLATINGYTGYISAYDDGDARNDIQFDDGFQTHYDINPYIFDETSRYPLWAERRRLILFY